MTLYWHSHSSLRTFACTANPADLSTVGTSWWRCQPDRFVLTGDAEPMRGASLPLGMAGHDTSVAVLPLPSFRSGSDHSMMAWDSNATVDFNRRGRTGCSLEQEFSMATQAPDYASIKQRQQAMWANGDFAAIGTHLVVVSENLCDAVDLRAGSEVLDVACGSGNTAIAAARRFCHVTGIDYVPELLERGQEHASAERLSIEFQKGDAESLAFPDASFDVVLSTFGTMFAPEQAVAAAETLRVCRSGGKIGMANWTPEGFARGLFRVVGKHRPQTPGLHPPSRWGTRSGLEELLGDGVSSLELNERHFVFQYESPAHWLDFFRTHFGPVRQVFATLDGAAARGFAADLLALAEGANTATDGTLTAPAAYLEVVAVRR